MPGTNPTPGRKNSRWKIAILAIACLGLASVTYRAVTMENHPEPTFLSTRQILERRAAYHKRFNRPEALIRAYERGAHILRIENPSPGARVIENPAPFFTLRRIEAALNLQPQLTDSEKIARIFDFVVAHRRHTYPLYETTEMHDPVYYFNVYGSGYCDDVSQNLAQLASHFGYQSQIYWLRGHVVASVFHDDAWRIYDADLPGGLGMLSVNGEVATLEDMTALAHLGYLPRFNDAYKHRVGLTAVSPRWGSPVPELRMQPCERLLFFDGVYMLSNEGTYLEEIDSRENYLGAFDGIIANYVAEIPLSCQNGNADEIVIDSYFPLSGLFLRIPKQDPRLSPADYPNIDLDTDMGIADATPSSTPDTPVVSVQIDDRFILRENDTHVYFDLTVFLKNLEYRPSNRIRLSGIRPLAARGGATLLSIHNYSVLNADFSDKALATLRTESLVVTKH